MNTYSGPITEFVDWVTGEDTLLTESEGVIRTSSTDGTPVSGASIRELLQTHLKKPFTYYEDKTAGLYRLFSSEEAKNLWLQLSAPGAMHDEDAASKLELFTFVRPADSTVSIKSLEDKMPAVSGTRYIIYGDKDTKAAKINFAVEIKPEPDVFTITYNITDSNKIVHTFSESRDTLYANGVTPVYNIDKNIYDYLTIGLNSVTVTVKAANSSASDSFTLVIYLMLFELSSTFNCAQHYDPSRKLEIPFSISRSNSDLSLNVRATVYTFENGNKTGTVILDPKEISSKELNPGGKFEVDLVNGVLPFASNSGSSKIKHTIRLEADMHDSGTGSYHYSNALFIDFVVASDEIGITNRFINASVSVPHSLISTDDSTGKLIIPATQYEPFSLKWAYYTDRLGDESTLDIDWFLRKIHNDNVEDVRINTLEGRNNSVSETLRFIPDVFSRNDTTLQLVAKHNLDEIEYFPLNISESYLTISETGNYDFKLSAFGRSNTSENKDVWEDTTNGIHTTFTNIQFDDNSGWGTDDSFVTYGLDQYATIDYCPFPSGFTAKSIEIDFKPEKVVNNDDVVILIGDVNRGHIDITTNSATLYNRNESIVHTNFKANERIKIAFVFNPVSDLSNDPSSGLVYIINNGILERAASYDSILSYVSDIGNIKIGGSDSGVRVYNMRAYSRAITYQEELNNYIYDSEDKATILNRNDIFDGNTIKYDLVKNKIDTIVITGNLDNILNKDSGKDDSEVTATFSRECISDSTKDFTVTDGKLRKHGQSTLNYPITSIKLWTNKASDDDVQAKITLSPEQSALGYNKNRYIMKDGAIPANKFVLQANYADSSGTHNGALLRLINDTWFKTKVNINGEDRYVLRTAPQLFTTNKILTHDDSYLYEDGSWVEGWGNGQRAIFKDAVTDTKARSHTWNEIAGKDFPYLIRTAPDSFPCAVFYRTGNNASYNFLGQYVFMDDKKSDHLYGERSIYYFGSGTKAGTDPFVLKTENTKNGPNGKQDIKENCVWDNKDVLRIEVVLPNTKLSSYLNFNVPSLISLDEYGNVVNESGSAACTDIKYDNKGNKVHYYWEDYFEMIYPDPDDIAKDDAEDNMDKYNPNSKFVKKAKPFVDFLKWITDCKNHYEDPTDWWEGNVYHRPLDAFLHTAHDHLDLYKLAAYYIFFLRFGLVDSVERNALLKTYDGQHWHYEPWDMDIALGNTNQGALVLNPPLDRNSFEPGTDTYAYSGRTTSSSNFLWDQLEGWLYWSDTVVPKVAQGLYEAGLDYDNVIKMFDQEYSEKWAEGMYNLSGYFKYIQSGGASWLAWLQGARTSHRHWWLSTSMNYYDAKWTCGSFKQYKIKLFTDKVDRGNNSNVDVITIKPTSDTFFSIASNDGDTIIGPTQAASREFPASFDISQYAISAKDPTYVYGGRFVEEIDLSCFSEKLKAVDFSLCYDDVLGAPIKKVNIGVPYTETTSTVYNGKVSGTLLRITSNDGNKDAFANLKEINISGQGSIKNTTDLLYNRDNKNVLVINAIGSGISSFTSSKSGNKFISLKLPGVTTKTHQSSLNEVSALSTITMHNSSWTGLEFWDTSVSGDVLYQTVNGNMVPNAAALEPGDAIAYDSDDMENANPIIIANNATFTKSTIPADLGTVLFLGSTASNACAGLFVLDWIASIEASMPNGYTTEDLYRVLEGKQFEAENIDWTPAKGINISYDTLAKIAHFNNCNNYSGKLKGYITINNGEPLTTTQLNKLVEWFGPSVFTKSSRNSNLVIDQLLNYTRITFTGTTVENDNIVLKEGNRSSVRATKFTLSDTDDTEYEWSISATNPIGGGMQSATLYEGEPSAKVLSCYLERGNDGVVYLIAEEDGTYGDYTLTVTVTISGVSQSQNVLIKGVDVPSTMNILTQVAQNGNVAARRFYMDSTIASSSIDLIGKQSNDSWVLYNVGQKIEFYPRFDITPGTTGVASLKSLQYLIASNSAISYENLSGGDGTTDTQIFNLYISYNSTARQNGIVLVVTSVPEQFIVIPLTVYATVGGRLFTKVVNIIVWDDNIVKHDQSTSQGVQNTLSDRFNSIYGLNTAPTQYYKSDLYSIHGKLDFSQYPLLVGSVFTKNINGVEPLIKYLPNVTELDFTGCTSVNPSSTCFGTYDSITHILTFYPHAKLQTLSFKECSTGNTDVIDLSGCTSLTSVDFRGAEESGTITVPNGIGVRLINSGVTSLLLGSPISVTIINPTSLGLYGTTLTILSSSNLSNIDIESNTQTSSKRVFSMFNTLYNPT